MEYSRKPSASRGKAARFFSVCSYLGELFFNEVGSGQLLSYFAAFDVVVVIAFAGVFNVTVAIAAAPAGVALVAIAAGIPAAAATIDSVVISAAVVVAAAATTTFYKLGSRIL